jgi:two-component system response regulator BaeR
MVNREILIVEDEIQIMEILRDYLTKAGYRVTGLDRGDTVVPHMRQNPPGLILLDIMLPGMDGMDVCREIRKFSEVPIIMITARVEEIDRLLGLELGADDFICKPFSPREVVARVKAVLRRMQAPQPTDRMIAAGEVCVIPETHQVLVAGHEVKLTPCEHNLLKTLLSHPNRIFSRNGVQIRVQDQGPGVPRKDLHNLFRPFYRVSHARERQTGGAGLGLTIAERALRLHGGGIAADNLPEGGLMITITLPSLSCGQK